tara:strand:+ start:1031 stop:1279 length:249 start_codon:yes stop_codon:yes gene_type:complete
MVFTIKDIDKVLSYKTWSNRKKEDELLKVDCTMYCNLGKDSTRNEKLEVRKASRKIYLAIKQINPTMGTLFLQTMDSAKEKQ